MNENKLKAHPSYDRLRASTLRAMDSCITAEDFKKSVEKSVRAMVVNSSILDVVMEDSFKIIDMVYKERLN